MTKLDKLIKDNDIKEIWLDVDGVILQSVKAMCVLIEEDYGIKLMPQDVVNWNFHDDLTPKQIEHLFANERFFNIVEFYDGFFSFYYKYEDMIHIITKGTGLNLAKKMNLLINNGVDSPYFGIPLDGSKGEIDMCLEGNSLFVDDCVKNLNESNATVKVLFREFDNGCEWQQGWDGLEIKEWYE